jgi:hopene-associated glycosyltransferase HpnB
MRIIALYSTISSLFLLILTGASVVSLVVWVYLALFHGRFWRARDESAPVAEAPVRRVAVIIPARDEAETIGRAVASLARQDYAGDLRIFVVDDHSSDGTADRARSAADGVAVVPAEALPAGWTGKMWAVAQGLKRALAVAPDYVLLTDADIEHAPDNVRSLVARAERDGLDLASFMVRLGNGTLAERALIPAFVFFFFKLYPPARAKGAAGGCMLVRAAALERIGGVERIRGEMIDDCALAREITRSGGRIWLGLTAQTHSLRSYGGFGDIAHMIARTAFTQLGHSAIMLAGTVLGMLLIYVVPPAAALCGIWYGVAAWLIMAALYVPMLRFYGQSLAWAPLLPLVALFYTGATIQSAVRYWTGRGGSWKGRVQDARRPFA